MFPFKKTTKKPNGHMKALTIKEIEEALKKEEDKLSAVEKKIGIVRVKKEERSSTPPNVEKYLFQME